MTFGLAGKYQLETFKADLLGNEIPGSREVRVPWFDNLITTAGMNLVGSSTADNLTYCRVGTGSTTPAFTDTALVAQVATSNTTGAGGTSGIVTTGTPYMFRRVSKRFAAGAASGVNLSEVGMSAATTGSIFSRALIADGSGNPTTITLAADEILDILYELRCYVSQADTTATVTIDGASTTVTMRPHAFSTHYTWTNSAAVLGAQIAPRVTAGNNTEGLHTLDTQPAASVVPATTSSTESGALVAYVAGSFRQLANQNLAVGEGNYSGGLGCVVSSSSSTSVWGLWTYGFSPKINKTSTRTATLQHGLSWARYTP